MNQGSSPAVHQSVNKWAVLTVVLVGVFMAMLDSSIINVALPVMVRSLHTEFSAVQWVPLAYLLAVTCAMMLVGRLADTLGKRTLYTAGFLVFTAASLACGLSGTISGLIAARVVQGLGAALIMALGPAILVETFPPTERGRALGITGSVVSLGIIVGPTLGGVLLERLDWGWIFFVNLPLGVAGAVMAHRLVSARRPDKHERFDLAGAALLTIGLVAVLLGLTIGQKPEVGPAAMWALVLGGVAVLGAFIALELRVASPLVDLRMFKNTVFSTNLAASFFNFLPLAGMVILMPFYLQTILHHDPRTAGFLLASMPIVLGITAPLAGSLSDKYGTHRVCIAGLFVFGVALLGLTTLSATTDELGFVVRFVPIGLGLGLFQSPNNSAILGSAPRERMGVASGLLALTRTFGQTSGIALLSVFWSLRVAAHAGGMPAGGATQAAPGAQLAGLHDTLVLMVVLTGLSLALVSRALWMGRRAAIAPATAKA
ncbi:MAG TPA: DHA2 family efflux MFS transporter permease subunit [Kofleriaceae bacterium]|jgi:EmrB/QacA subfamily drug resistance transporter|nr:DHA2 family efflux MFS transporter permease subunit [Kofleriaceae bacterium]